MLHKLFPAQSQSITGAAILISGATLISRVVGLLRERIFAHYYGTSMVMDAYNAAFKLPDLAYNLLIIGAISAGFIPLFTKLLHDKPAAWKLANNIVNILGMVVFVLAILGIIFMPSLMPYLAPGFNAETIKLAVDFGRIMFISMFVLSLSMMMGTILQSLRSFFVFAIAPIFYNLGIVAGVVGFVPYLGLTGIAWGVVLGSVLHFGLQTYGAYQHGYRYQFVFDVFHKETVIMARLMIPRTLGLAIGQVNIVIITIIASLLPMGSVAIYNYANNLQGVPAGLIGIPFALAVFPVLSQAAADKDWGEFITHLSRAIRQILFLIIPISLIFLLLRAQIVRIVLGTGAFDWTATINTADALALFALGLFAQSLIPLLGRAFYALENTTTPFVIGVISELVSIIAALSLMRKLGVAGLALACSIGAVLNLILLSVYLRAQIKNIQGEKIWKSFWKIIIAGIVMAVAMQISKYPLAKLFNQDYFFGIFMQGAIAAILGLAIYAIICYAVKLPEFLEFWGSFKRRTLRWRRLTIDESIQLKN